MKSVYIIVALALFAVVSVSAAVTGRGGHRNYYGNRNKGNGGVMRSFEPCKDTCPADEQVEHHAKCGCDQTHYYDCVKQNKPITVWKQTVGDPMTPPGMGRTVSDKCNKKCWRKKHSYYKCVAKSGYGGYGRLDSEDVEILEGTAADVASGDALLLDSENHNDEVSLAACCKKHCACDQVLKKFCFYKEYCKCKAERVCKDNSCGGVGTLGPEMRSVTWNSVNRVVEEIICTRVNCTNYMEVSELRECNIKKSNY